MEVFVSTEMNVDAIDIAHALAKDEINATVIPNATSHMGSTERGFSIKFHNSELTGHDFRYKIWHKILQPMLNLECAFIKVKNGYHGCIMEWSDVFREPACPSAIRKRTQSSYESTIDPYNRNNIYLWYFYTSFLMFMCWNSASLDNMYNP